MAINLHTHNLTLYGRDETGSAAIEALLAEAAIPFSLVNVPSNNVTNENDISARDAYRAINPLGQVPSLKISPKTGGGRDILMTESAAIMLWLGDCAASELAKAGFFVPNLDDALRADYLRWLFFFATEHYQTHLFFAYARRWTNDNPDHVAVQRAKAQEAIDRQLNMVEQRLGTAAYFFGDKASPLDFYAAMLFGWHSNISQFPRSTALMKRMVSRPVSAAIWARHKIG